MASYKILIAALLLATIIGTVLARPGNLGYSGYSSPISYTTYSYPSYGYGHGLYSAYSYPYSGYSHGYGYGHGYGHSGYGFGGLLGNYW